MVWYQRDGSVTLQVFLYQERAANHIDTHQLLLLISIYCTLFRTFTGKKTPNIFRTPMSSDLSLQDSLF